jgi:hypothetical protein
MSARVVEPARVMFSESPCCDIVSTKRLHRDRIQAVIELMPHIWSPFVMVVVHAAGARYCTVVHDADAHPGDQTSWVKALIDRSPLSADVVLT